MNSARLREHDIPRVLEKYGDKVAFEYIAVDDEESFKLQLLYEEKYGVSSDEAVKLFAGESCLCGAKAIKADIDRVVAAALAKKEHTPILEEVSVEYKASAAADRVIQRRFSALSPLLVISAGLIDGINPCAFVTIVFFISLLSMLKKTRREILIVGTVFSGAVFFTYLLLGMGMLRTVKLVSVNSGASRAIAFSTGIFALSLGVYSFADFLSLKRGERVFLKLPQPVRNRINLLLSSGMRQKNVLISAFGLGVVISLLESMYTGQVYLPTLVYMLQNNRLRLNALFYLVIYNAMFIVPLLVIFACAYAGLSSKNLSAFLTKNARFIKFLMSLLFFVMGGILIRRF